jgi:glutamate decarboxylase
MDRLLGEKNKAEGLSVYIHVDGASGGFVAPFANPDLEWDFRLVRILYCEHNHNELWLICGRFVQSHVCSINASGHKCMLLVEFCSPLLTNSVDGLTYAGVGWAIWRNKSFLPDDILFTVNYLGSPQVSFTLNFSKSGVHVIGQYYQFLRLGKAGYRNIVRFFFVICVAGDIDCDV